MCPADDRFARGIRRRGQSGRGQQARPHVDQFEIRDSAAARLQRVNTSRHLPTSLVPLQPNDNLLY